MKVELLNITPNAEVFIGRCAAICYDASQEEVACVKRAASCVDKGHLATLRFAHATFNVSGISRACSHQFVRSKHLDFLQRSQRYCVEEEPEFIIPPAEGWDLTYRIHNIQAYDTYRNMIRHGVRKEDARYVLPEATATELNVTGNFQAWLNFISLRSGKEAQWEIRAVAHEINKQLHQQCPNIFKEII